MKREEIPAGLPARRVAVAAVDGVLRRRAPLDAALDADRRLDALDPRDRAFARSLARLACRRLGQILATLDEKLTHGMPKRAGALEAILATGVAQLLYMDVPDHAAVDLSVRLAREDAEAGRYSGLVNAVLRGIARDGKSTAGPEANIPEWLGERWAKNYGGEAALAMVEAQLGEPPLDLTAKADPALWAERLGGTPLPTGTIRLAAPKGPISALPGFGEGAWWVQDAGALLPVLALGDVAGKRVLDLCAAPGGKTAALAARGAKVTAVERNPERAARLARNLDRLGLEATMVVRDALEFRFDAPFDAVLLDAPCSATGTLRRHPDVAWIKRPEDIASLARVQAALLDRAAEALAPGGRLTYATCSLEPEEGEDQIRAVLARRPDLAIEPIAAAQFGGLAEMIGAEGFARSRPDMLAGIGGIDGFFVARLSRSA